VITLGSSSIVDAIGRQYQLGQAAACTLLTYPGFNGNSRTIKVCHDTLHNVLRADQLLQPVQSLWDVIANADLANYNQVFDISNLISEIDLPDGSAYKLKYDSYGSVARVELPTGGAVEYDYTPVIGYATDPSSVQIVNLSRALVERREYLNVSDNTPSRVSKYNGQTVMDYDGQGNLLAKTVHNVVSAPATPLTNPTLYEYGLIGKEMETKYYAADGQTLLRDVVNQWQLRSCGYQSTCGNPAGAPFDPMITSVTTTQNGATKQTTFGYDDYNNVNDQKDFDCGSGAPGPLLRHIVTYYEQGAYDSLPVYQPGLPAQVNTYDGSGNLVALRYLHHDQFALTDAPGIIDHDGAYDLNNTVRGNLTQKSSWINTSG
jgi:YD repeat-containing protein